MPDVAAGGCVSLSASIACPLSRRPVRHATQVHGAASDLQGRLSKVAVGESTMNEAVGPAVGCLMATFGTNMISSCIFEFPDPPDIA